MLQRHQRRGAAAEKNGVHGTGASRRAITDLLNLARQGAPIGGDQVVQAGVGIEIAVGAPKTAKWNVKVQAKRVWALGLFRSSSIFNSCVLLNDHNFNSTGNYPAVQRTARTFRKNECRVAGDPWSPATRHSFFRPLLG